LCVCAYAWIILNNQTYCYPDSSGTKKQKAFRPLKHYKQNNLKKQT
jgi:hypothetical protein